MKIFLPNLLAAFLTAGVASWTTSLQSYEYVVRIETRFNPDHLEVRIGDSVLWNNFDGQSHSVTAEFLPFGVQDAFDSGEIPSGGTYRSYFGKPGLYRYRCRYHPDVTGTVTVTP